MSSRSEIVKYYKKISHYVEKCDMIMLVVKGKEIKGRDALGLLTFFVKAQKRGIFRLLEREYNKGGTKKVLMKSKEVRRIRDER